MAKKALIHLGFLHVCDLHRHHLEMHHVVAGRGLVTLRAGLRTGRWMPEIWESPLGGGVALRTVVAKQAVVPVFGGVAARAVQQ